MKKLRIICALALTAGLLAGCSKIDDNKEASIQVLAMDTYMNIKAYGGNAQDALDEAKQEILRLDDLLSTGSDTSVITQLNVNGSGKLDADVSYLVEKSIEINKETEGAFDITIYPVMRLWGFTDQNFKVPDKEALTSLLAKVDTSAINYDKSTGELKLPEGVEIDLGGIAKGYTGEQVAKILRENGIKSACINLGGNVQVIGTKVDGSKWKVGVENPAKDGTYLGAVQVADKAVVTSGGYERYFEEEGITYHHIIDPTTGYPANNGLASVTIVCDDGTLADGLSTSLFIMGPDKAVTFWKEHSEEFECVLYTDDGKLLVSEGLKDSFTSNEKFEVIETK